MARSGVICRGDADGTNRVTDERAELWQAALLRPLARELFICAELFDSGFKCSAKVVSGDGLEDR